MPSFHAIAAMSENRVIGDHGKIPWHLPDDFRWFKHKTMGGTLIMGRKTFESIGKPLPGRKTIVLTKQQISIPGVEIYSDADLLIQTLMKHLSAQPELGEHIRFPTEQEPPSPIIPWICGGAEIYQRFLPECRTLYLTRVKRSVDGDALFPQFEDQFELEQIIHETDEFRVERWFRSGWTHYIANEPWPFPPKE